MYYFIVSRFQNNKPLQTGHITDDLSDVRQTSKLTLHNVTPDDTGTYKCVSQAADSQTTWTTYCHIYVCSKLISNRISNSLIKMLQKM